ncbi:MAG: methyltransferase domain-containing protein [Nannocystaceae bacterium]
MIFGRSRAAAASVTMAVTLSLACGAEPAPVASPSVAPARSEPGGALVAEAPADASALPEGADAAHDGPTPGIPGPDDTPPTHFEGREIAQTMSFLGAGWLTRSNRDDEEDTTTLHRALALRPGQTACDVGAGNGYHTVRMAKAVGPTGRVLAVDIQPQMLAMLRAAADEQGLDNVETIEARPGDPRLPAGACDLILLVDVYHELAWPEPMLAGFRRALSATGRLALVEYRAEDPDVPIKRLHKMSKAQIERELGPRGFSLAESFDGLPWQHLLLYERDDAQP